MKTFIFLAIVLLSLCGAERKKTKEEEDYHTWISRIMSGIDEKEFEQIFHLDPVEDPEEYKRRNEALRENEEEIEKTNEAYEKGEKTWFDALNEFSDLPADEFVQRKTGAISITEGRGLIEPSPEDRVNEESERYFDQFRYSRASVPAAYSARDMGLVSPVKNQYDCGSCVSFASVAAIETCYKKITNVFGDYSEQQFVDCGYGINGANGCNGAPPHAYLKLAADNKMGLAHESQYPYLNLQPNLKCPANLPVYNQGARVFSYHHTYDGTEELMKNLVYKHGAVVTTVKTNGTISNYKGGIFAGCAPGNEVDHAVTVVGYGSEGGVDYWLVKNSWGPTWGEDGYFRIKRGVHMCGIGNHMSVVSCSKVTGPTDGPLTTQKPCVDQYSNCAELARTACWDEKIGNSCAKSCGLCSGMTPARSYTCYDQFSNCPAMTAHCSEKQISTGCKKSCRLC